MKCEMCKKQDATVRYTEVVNKKVVKMNLCEECAKKKGVVMQAPFSIADLLSGLTGLAIQGEEDLKKVCPGCGLAYADFKKNGRLGCDSCYSAFAQGLQGLIESIHRSMAHTGKIPSRARAEIEHTQALRELEAKLCTAVEKEAFEEAAGIRDQIQTLKKDPRPRGRNRRAKANGQA
ncbi:MAG: UvrB/UvrC motif-containing protein [Candidatus Aureabacteria bacterium]|nr:UvrB/UvrC motif-containing protein [Candidatus Auribacterota bacterium]